MSQQTTYLSPAKLNLFLHVCGKRPDGYHELQTCFQLIDFCDELTFTLNHTGNITLTGMDIPAEGNLIIKAAKALQHDLQQGAAIHIEKHIPQGAGLGGGSSNAATTLLALNKLWHLNLPENELLKIGKALGADVPIFILGRNAFAEGIGEKLTPIDLPEKTFLLHKPDVQVHTAEFFSHPLLTRDTKKKRIAAFLDEASNEHFCNDFEPLARKLYPEIDSAFETLSAYGQVKMTGTGSCLFLSFDSTEQANEVANQLAPSMKTVVARSVKQSPALTVT